jgi:hypothetical protein
MITASDSRIRRSTSTHHWCPLELLIHPDLMVESLEAVRSRYWLGGIVAGIARPYGTGSSRRTRPLGVTILHRASVARWRNVLGQPIGHVDAVRGAREENHDTQQQNPAREDQLCPVPFTAGEE